MEPTKWQGTFYTTPRIAAGLETKNHNKKYKTLNHVAVATLAKGPRLAQDFDHFVFLLISRKGQGVLSI